MIEIRRAIESDIDFIVEAIIEAEKSGTDKLSYSTMFGLSEAEVRDILRNALLEDIPGQELCISGFMLALIDGVPSGAACSWIEEADDIPSAILKANILFHFFKCDFLFTASEKNRMIEQMNIPREKGTIQIESVYVSNKFRGLGVSNQIILEHIKRMIRNGQNADKIQIQLAGNNLSALRSYEKLGFRTVVVRKCEDAEILRYLPSDTRIMMELMVEELIIKGLLNID